MVLLFNVCETVSISLYLDIIMYIIYIYTRCKWRENCTWHDRNAKRHLTRWLHLMSEACVWTVDSHVQKHTRRWLHTQKAWMLFPYSQLLGAESLPAGSVWSHWDALHLSEEGRSQWDRTTVLSAWRHLLCSPPSFSPAMTASIPYSYPHSFSLHPFWAFMCCCHVLAWCTIISVQVCCKSTVWFSLAVQSTGIKVLLLSPDDIVLYLLLHQSCRICSIITGNKITGFTCLTCECACKCNAQMCAEGVCMKGLLLCWHFCSGVVVLFSSLSATEHIPPDKWMSTVCVCVCLFVWLAAPE